MIVAGIDIGSLSTETVLIDENRTILSYSIVFTGANSKKASNASFEEAIDLAVVKREDIGYVLSTGYGRERVDFADDQVTEITCHARGLHFLHPATRSIIDIGGQDSKAISINEQGKVMNFAMNDKCAAGTGRFLEVMARALEIELDEMGDLSLRSSEPVSISSMCTVFAESEVISLIADGMVVEDIILGIHQSVSGRVTGLLDRVGAREEIAMSGGVAKNKGVVTAIEENLGLSIHIPDEPQIIGSLGASLIALDRVIS